jgi:hypothetical protein
MSMEVEMIFLNLIRSLAQILGLHRIGRITPPFLPPGDPAICVPQLSAPFSLISLPQCFLPANSPSAFNMLLLDYQNVLIESLLKDRFSGYASLRHLIPTSSTD